MQNDTTIWYAGPLTELEYNTHHEPIMSWNSAHPLCIEGYSEVSVKGFRPTLSGTKPLRSTEWPKAPPPPKPPKPRKLRDYGAVELVDEIERLTRQREQDLENGLSPEDLKGVKDKIEEYKNEVIRRLGKPTWPKKRKRAHHPRG